MTITAAAADLKATRARARNASFSALDAAIDDAFDNIRAARDLARHDAIAAARAAAITTQGVKP